MNAQELFTFDPKGLSRRVSYIVAWIIALAVTAVAVIVSQTFGLQRYLLGDISLVVCGLWVLIIQIRRLRDIGWSPWWAVILLSPLSVILVILLMFIPGKEQKSANSA